MRRSAAVAVEPAHKTTLGPYALEGTPDQIMAMEAAILAYNGHESFIKWAGGQALIQVLAREGLRAEATDPSFRVGCGLEKVEFYIHQGRTTYCYRMEVSATTVIILPGIP